MSRPVPSVATAFRLAGLVGIVLTTVLPVAVHASTRESLTDYTMTVWSSEKGAPPGDVFALAEDADGYIWIGTPTGLLRFDGSKFTPWTEINSREPLPTGPVHVLLVAHDGSLWVEVGGGGGVVRIARGHLTRYQAAEGAPTGATALLEDREGTIWAAGRRGLFRYADGKWSLESRGGYPGSEAFALFEDHAGTLWVSSASGIYKRTAAGFTLVDATPTNVQSLTEDASGNIWVSDTTKIVMRLSDHFVPKHDELVRLPAAGWRVMADRRGQMWVATFGGGVLRIAPDRAASPALRRFEYEQRFSGSPRAIHEDRDGNIWIGMRGGLIRLSERSFDTSVALDGLTHDGVRTMAIGRDGSTWIATGHGVNRFRGGTRDVYDVPLTLALHVDRTGTVWASTAQGLRRFDGARFVSAAIDAPVEWSRVMALTTDAQNRLWLCSTLKGVAMWDGKALTTFHHVPAVSDRGCQSIATDAQDRVWIGFQSGDAAVFDGGTFRALGERDGITRGTVLAILQGQDGAIWLSTSEGVSRYQNGRITAVTRVHAPLVDVVPVLVEDAEGYIWVGVNSGLGIIRFHPHEVDRIANASSHQLEYALYDETDGLQQSPLTWQSGVGGVRANDGRLWVTSGGGVALIDPSQLPRSRRPPIPYIESVVADGRRLAPEGNLRLPAGSSNLSIEYAAISPGAASKLRFRYRVDGVDDDWVYAGTRREAIYAGLGSGQYRFRVNATYDGQWAEAGQWEFSVASPVYLQGWFLTVAAATILLLIGAAWWLRMRVMKQRYALVFAERARVSREIHDTLLQSLAGLGVELEALATQIDPGQPGVRDTLRRLRREVGHALRDARESILELRRDAMITREVADALRDVAARTSTTRNARVEVSVSGRRPSQCPADVDLQLFRIGQEAIANAMRHGDASRIDIAIRYEKDRVVLTVHDNGCGFMPDAEDPARETGEHLGLVTMRERAARLRGRVDVLSRPGAGTTVEAMIPVES